MLSFVVLQVHRFSRDPEHEVVTVRKVLTELLLRTEGLELLLAAREAGTLSVRENIQTSYDAKKYPQNAQ